MNSKKAKRLRRELKEAGVDITDKKYGKLNGTLKTNTAKDILGNEYSYHTTSTGLTAYCGRDIYKKAKILIGRSN